MLLLSHKNVLYYPNKIILDKHHKSEYSVIKAEHFCSQQGEEIVQIREILAHLGLRQSN